VSRLCVLTVFSVFLLVFLFLPLSLPSLSSHHEDEIDYRRRRRRRRTSKRLDDRSEGEREEKEKEKQRRTTPRNVTKRGKGIEGKVRRLHSVECRPSDT
jgi:hypothetical protein